MGSSDRDVADRAGIDLNDLTSPRLTDVQRQILKFHRGQGRREQLHQRGGVRRRRRIGLRLKPEGKQ